jgi:hypothetical protein
MDCQINHEQKAILDHNKLFRSFKFTRSLCGCGAKLAGNLTTVFAVKTQLAAAAAGRKSHFVKFLKCLSRAAKGDFFHIHIFESWYFGDHMKFPTLSCTTVRRDSYM